MKRIVTIPFIFLLILFLTGCSAPQEEADDPGVEDKKIPQQNKNLNRGSSNVKYITNLMAIADDYGVEVSFSLLNGTNGYTSANGIANVRIVNSKNEVVYKETKTVNKEDFDTYILRLTGEEIEAYAWDIPLSQIKKSVSVSGMVYLNFETNGLEFEELEASVWGLPVYDEAELAALNEQQFSKNAITVDKTQSKGDFEVTVQRVGSFEPEKEYGDQVEYFRIDMKVKNIGNEKEYFSPSGMALLDNKGNQYESEHSGTLDTFSEIYPGIKKEGYVLFEMIPKSTQSVKLVFELGRDKNYNNYLFEYDIDLTK